MEIQSFYVQILSLSHNENEEEEKHTWVLFDGFKLCRAGRMKPS